MNANNEIDNDKDEKDDGRGRGKKLRMGKMSADEEGRGLGARDARQWCTLTTTLPALPCAM
jgi:hypothetical protein